MPKSLLDDRVLGSLIIAAVLTAIIVNYNGEAVTDAVNHPGLVSDSEALLAARDALGGSATLNWSVKHPSSSGMA